MAIGTFLSTNSKVKFSDEVKTNYLGVILGYFTDTFDIIFVPQLTETYTERFSTT
jgi:hypothetical protein